MLFRSSAENEQVKGNGYSTSNCSLESRIELGFVFDPAVVTQDMYAIVTYTNHVGEECEDRVDGSEFEIYTKGRWRIPVNGLAVADGVTLVTCTIYDADDNVISVAKDSVNSYLSRAIAANGGNLYVQALKFTKSAYAYFH